jgi:hypothetical protein
MTHVCGATDTQEGRDAFRYQIPLAVPAWGMFLGGGPDVSNTWHEGPPTELRMNCEFRGQFNSPAQAQTWCMKVLAGLPLYRRGHIQWLRLKAGGMPDIGFERIEIEKRAAIIFQARIICECVFLTAATFDD